jgi:hypothetical protein
LLTLVCTCRESQRWDEVGQISNFRLVATAGVAHATECPRSGLGCPEAGEQIVGALAETLE